MNDAHTPTMQLHVHRLDQGHSWWQVWPQQMHAEVSRTHHKTCRSSTVTAYGRARSSDLNPDCSPTGSTLQTQKTQKGLATSVWEAMTQHE